MSIPKTISGVLLCLAGAGAAQVPFLQVLSPYLISSGIGAITVGIGAKVNRAIKKQDVFQNEKQMINSIKNKGNAK